MNRIILIKTDAAAVKCLYSGWSSSLRNALLADGFGQTICRREGGYRVGGREGVMGKELEEGEDRDWEVGRNIGREARRMGKGEKKRGRKVGKRK